MFKHDYTAVHNVEVFNDSVESFSYNKDARFTNYFA